MKKPNLFIIGEAKSGTTALLSLLGQHSQICISDIKEPSYFCKDLHEKSDNKNGVNTHFPIREVEKYLKLFRSKKEDKYLAEASIDYSYSKDAAKNIFKFNKDSKIIYMVREPSSFLHSLHSSRLVWFVEDEINFEKALELEKKRESGKKIPKSTPCVDMILYDKRANYSEHLKRYIELFENDNILVIIFEDFTGNSQKEINRVMNFLDLKKEFTPEMKKQNKNISIRFPMLRRIIINESSRKIAKILIRKKYLLKLEKIYLKVMNVEKPREKMKEATKQKLINKYKEKMKEFQTLLEKNNLIEEDLMKKWNY